MTSNDYNEWTDIADYKRIKQSEPEWIITYKESSVYLERLTTHSYIYNEY